MADREQEPRSVRSGHTGPAIAAVTPRFERVLIPLLFRSQLHRAARRLNRGGVVIVMYHGFTAVASRDGIANHEEKHLHGDAFRAHLVFLKTHYRVVSLDEVVSAWTTGSPLPERAAVITIDDGYRSTYTIAYKALKELQLPAAVFLTTGFVDDRRYLWTDRVEYAVSHTERETMAVTVGGESLDLDLRTPELRIAADRRLRSSLKGLPQETRDEEVDAVERAAGCSVNEEGSANETYEPLFWSEAAEMAASGLITIGSHTHTHVILARCKAARAAEELRVSKRIIEDRLARPCHLFCYPNGRRGDFNGETRRLVQDHGYAGALTTVYGMNGRGADVYELRRYNLGKPLMPGELEVRLSGLMEVGASFRKKARGSRPRARA
jgi:peptidoglycan/xylan/chitin deacetylase (PgdA/CDA1 family)